MRLTTFFALATILALPAAGSAQQSEIRGRVVEFGTRTGISGVSIDLDGVGRTTTNNNGQFQFSAVPAGTHRLSFSVIGYQSREIELDLRADTALVIELEVAAVRLDSVVVRARTITLRGQVRDPAKQLEVVDAEVLIGALKPSSSNVAGNFKIGRVPANTAVPIEVRAVGYMPYRSVISADRDTTVRIDLTADPLGRKMIDEHLAKLELRGRGIPYARRQFNQDQLISRRGQTIEDFLKAQLGGRAVTCLFIDEVEQSFVANEILRTYFVEELHRLEIYDRGLMVRVYTARHLQRNIGSSRPLRSITLVKTPRGPICQ